MSEVWLISASSSDEGTVRCSEYEAGRDNIASIALDEEEAAIKEDYDMCFEASEETLADILDEMIRLEEAEVLSMVELYFRMHDDIQDEQEAVKEDYRLHVHSIEEGLERQLDEMIRADEFEHRCVVYEYEVWVNEVKELSSLCDHA